MEFLIRFRNKVFSKLVELKLNTHSVSCVGKIYIKADRSAKTEIKNSLLLGGNSIAFNSRPSMLRLDKDSRLIINGDAQIFYGADIILFQGGCLEIGNSFINSDCRIRCHKSIRIGDGCAISHEFSVMDSDAHYLNGDKHTAPVEIENHVWIGSRVTILSGVKVGEGAVIAANSLVNKDVPPHTLVGGCPAKVLKDNVEWKS